MTVAAPRAPNGRPPLAPARRQVLPCHAQGPPLAGCLMSASTAIKVRAKQVRLSPCFNATIYKSRVSRRSPALLQGRSKLCDHKVLHTYIHYIGTLVPLLRSFSHDNHVKIDNPGATEDTPPREMGSLAPNSKCHLGSPPPANHLHPQPHPGQGKTCSVAGHRGAGRMDWPRREAAHRSTACHATPR